VLAVYHGFYGAVEAGLLARIAADAIPFSYRERRKLPWLVQDLHALGDELPSPRVVAPGWDPADVADLVGVLYPIEGSTLGGQVISRHLRDNLGLTPERGARFFYGYGPDTARRWDAFCAFAEQLAGDPDACRRAAAVAGRVFTVLEGLLDECLLRQP
jgi:heme oxygenase